MASPFQLKPGEVKFHDESIKVRHIWCRHIAKPKKQ